MTVKRKTRRTGVLRIVASSARDEVLLLFVFVKKIVKKSSPKSPFTFPHSTLLVHARPSFCSRHGVCFVLVVGLHGVGLPLSFVALFLYNRHTQRMQICIDLVPEVIW